MVSATGFQPTEEFRAVSVRMAAARTSRIDLRADPDRERRIKYAAELERKSVSAFVLEAAADRAEEVIASASTTVVPSEFFQQLWDALDVAPEPNPVLRRRAEAARRVEPR